MKMREKYKRKRTNLFLTLLLSILMISFLTGFITYNSNSSKSEDATNITPITPPTNTVLEAKDISFPIINYTGSGTPRESLETLWRNFPLGNQYANYQFTINLPGTSVWTGSHIDITIDNIYERKDWITNGAFGSALTNWNPHGTGGLISISTDQTYPGGGQGPAADFKFNYANHVSTNPPRYTIPLASKGTNNGDVGASTNWVAQSSTGASNADWYSNGRNSQTTGPGINGAERTAAAQNSPWTGDNRIGVWEFGISDYEGSDTAQNYDVTFEADYVFNVYGPQYVSAFKFQYYPYSTEFDWGERHECSTSSDTDDDQFIFDYNLYGPNSQVLGWTQLVDWSSTDYGDDPSDTFGSWQSHTLTDFTAINNLVRAGGSGTYTLRFRLRIYMDVDDGWDEKNCDIWGNCDCTDDDDEDTDWLFLWIDAVELAINVADTHAAGTTPGITQTITGFNGRNGTSSSYLQFDSYIPSSFYCGEVVDGDIYLNVSINSQPTFSYRLISAFSSDIWVTKTLDWIAIRDDLGYDPGPSSITVDFTLWFAATGWYADLQSKSIWIDNIILNITNYVDDVQLIECHDVENSQELYWDSWGRSGWSISHSDSWQTVYSSSQFWLNSSSSLMTVMEGISVTFYSVPHTPTLTPIFSLPTDEDGLTDTVTWTITHDVMAIEPGWNYNLTIPYIPNWNSTDWQVVSVKDSTNQPINFWEIPAGSGMKNISIYENDEDTTGNWVITCTSPNKITAFGVQNDLLNPTYEYYPGYLNLNSSQIIFTTGDNRSSNPLIVVNYSDHVGNPVDPAIYPNTTCKPNMFYEMPFWEIPNNQMAHDRYVAMVKWIDTGSYNDEVGFAAHYIGVIHNLTVSNIDFLHVSSNMPSNYVVSGEILRISVNVTDQVISPSLPLENATITFFYPLRTDPTQIGSTTEPLTQVDNTYLINLDTAGNNSHTWINSSAWMGMTGNRTFTINLVGSGTYLNGSYIFYQITGWFELIVDTDYTNIVHDTSEEQGQILYAEISLLDRTWGHQPANTKIYSTPTISGSNLINDRTYGTPITDLYPIGGDSVPDTWNDRVTVQWCIINDNLTGWCGGDIGQKNDPDHKWNGTLVQLAGTHNKYFTMIEIPDDALPTELGYGDYYLNITTTIQENEWGWLAEPQFMTLPYDNGMNGIYGDFDDHKACLKFEVKAAAGFATKLDLIPQSAAYSWKNETQEISRLYVRYYNESPEVGFNSTLLSIVPSYSVISWVVNYPGAPASQFGNSITTAISWTHVNSTTNLTDGSPDPYRENLADNSTWGYFYHDFNWTNIRLGLGTFDNPLQDQTITIHVVADIVNPSKEYQRAYGDFSITIKPNKIQLTVPFEYPEGSGNPSFLDPNYYPGQITAIDDYYWGDVLNFTIDARDTVNNISESGLSLRYYIEKQGTLVFLTEAPMPETGMPGRYSAILNTSDPAVGVGDGPITIYFQGIKMNRSVQNIDLNVFLKKHDTYLKAEQIAGVFIADSIYEYADINKIREIYQGKPYTPTIDIFRTVPNETIRINVSLWDNTIRHGGPIYDANITWKLIYGGKIQLTGWWNNSINGIFPITIDLHDLVMNESQLNNVFFLRVIPYKDHYESTEDFGPAGSYWDVQIIIGHRPIAIIPLTPISMTYSQSNWQYHPIQFVVQDLISRENISGCVISWNIEPSDYQGTRMEEYAPGHYQVIFDTWPSTFSWVSGGQYWLSAEIISTPYASYNESVNWPIAELRDPYWISLYVESEGFLGPLTNIFWMILGGVGLVVLGYSSYKSYKFLTTPYVIRKIQESINKISKDKKVAAGVMKSRDHLIFLEATDILRMVGVALIPPPEKKLPPPIEKIAPKIAPEEIEKIPEIPEEIISAELDNVGVRPEEKPILLQQIKELGPADRREFVESLIGEARFREIIEDLRMKGIKKA